MKKEISSELEFRKAWISDATEIFRLVNYYAEQGLMLSRLQIEIYEHLRDFTVCTDNEKVVGSAALQIYWDDLAEVKSLAVHPDYKGGRGIGSGLVRQCIEEARELGLKRVFALTYEPAFFTRLGFQPILKEDLPQKIWSECVRCPKFPNCTEEALLFSLNADK